MAPDKKIFVSHASLDAGLAKEFVDTMVVGGVSGDDIFFSSQRGMGIPAGGSVDDVLRTSITGAELVIELITPTFLTRPVCLMELGGAWALQIPTFPIVVPPLTHRDVTSAIGNFQMTSWADDTAIRNCFAELHDAIRTHATITATSSRWHTAVDGFTRKLPALLAHASPPTTAGPNATTAPTPAAALAAGPVPTQKGIAFGPHSVTRDRGRPRLHVEATNHGDQTKSGFIKATFYDQNGVILDSDSTPLNGIEPGTTRTLTFTDVPTFERVKFDVDTLF